MSISVTTGLSVVVVGTILYAAVHHCVQVEVVIVRVNKVSRLENRGK